MAMCCLLLFCCCGSPRFSAPSLPFILIVRSTDVPRSIVIQFEDFKNPFPALERYGGKYTCFNDDIQGTGAVVLAGIINAVKRSGVPIKDQRAVFMGAGSAGVGVAKQIVQYFMEGGLTEDEARRCFWFVDTKGMVKNDRGDKLADHKVYFSRDDDPGNQYKTLAEVVEFVKPTILMGLSTMGGIFDQSILTKMGQWNKHPIIFPLSNPSANSECTFEEAMEYTDGRALFASGSPFPSLERNGVVHTPGQGELSSVSTKQWGFRISKYSPGYKGLLISHVVVHRQQRFHISRGRLWIHCL